MKSLLMKSLLIMILFTSGLAASPVTISLSGTFGPGAQNNVYFAPSGAFSLSFQVNNPPTVAVSGSSFFTSYSASSYTLNGNPVALAGNIVAFSTTSSLLFCLDSPCSKYQMSSAGGSPQLFSGPVSSPTFVPGSYQVTSWVTETNLVFDGGSPSGGTITVTSTGAAVPEPSTWMLTLAGVLIAGARRKNGSAL
jgi:hypothetical protein